MATNPLQLKFCRTFECNGFCHRLIHKAQTSNMMNMAAYGAAKEYFFKNSYMLLYFIFKYIKSPQTYQGHSKRLQS